MLGTGGRDIVQSQEPGNPELAVVAVRDQDVNSHQNESYKQARRQRPRQDPESQEQGNPD